MANDTDTQLARLRSVLTRSIAATGAAPTIEELAASVGGSIAATEEQLHALHQRHALLLHPHKCVPWVVHPFALSPGACWVQTKDRGYWANCLYCAFGIAAALRCDAVVSTRLAGEGEPVRYTILGGEPDRRGDVFHLSTPASQWWDNVIFACASFQPFTSEAHIDPWCARHRLPRGAVLSIPQLWAFAQDWYGGYVQEEWPLRVKEEAMAIFARHGLTSAFWTL